MKDLFETLARIGFHGTLGLVVVLSVVFVAAYGTIHQPDHNLTSTALDALILGLGAIIGASVFMLKGGKD